MFNKVKNKFKIRVNMLPNCIFESNCILTDKELYHVK